MLWPLWATVYMALSEDDEVVSAFQRLGTVSLTFDDFSDKLPEDFAALESFLCSVYAPTNCLPRSIPELRYELFCTKNLESEKLPPTLPTFFLHILRTNFVTTRDKSYTTAHPNLPSLDVSGWEINDGKYSPVRCLLPPAPKSVLELVKCGCDPKKGCKGHCSCLKNKLPCTPLCKCYTTGCELFPAYKRDTKDVEEEDENFMWQHGFWPWLWNFRGKFLENLLNDFPKSLISRQLQRTLIFHTFSSNLPLWCAFFDDASQFWMTVVCIVFLQIEYFLISRQKFSFSFWQKNKWSFSNQVYHRIFFNTGNLSTKKFFIKW